MLSCIADQAPLLGLSRLDSKPNEPTCAPPSKCNPLVVSQRRSGHSHCDRHTDPPSIHSLEATQAFAQPVISQKGQCLKFGFPVEAALTVRATDGLRESMCALKCIFDRSIDLHPGSRCG